VQDSAFGVSSIQINTESTTCVIKAYQRLQPSGAPGATETLPIGRAPSNGYVVFKLTHCEKANVGVTLDLGNIPAGGEMWVYGRTIGRDDARWQRASSEVVGPTTVSFTVNDATDGDDDRLNNDDILVPVAGILVPVVGAYPVVQDIWWSGAAENGWGMSIVQHGAILSNVIYAYDDQGRPTWFVMPGGTWNAAHTAYTGRLQPAQRGLLRVRRHRVHGGQPGGHGHDHLRGNSSATLTYTINGRSGTKSITRQSFGVAATPTLNGLTDMWWGGLKQNGWGIAVIQQHAQLFLVWFTYESNGRPTWFVMPAGSCDGIRHVRGPVYLTSSSPWVGVPYDPFAPHGRERGQLQAEGLRRHMLPSSISWKATAASTSWYASPSSSGHESSPPRRHAPVALPGAGRGARGRLRAHARERERDGRRIAHLHRALRECRWLTRGPCSGHVGQRCVRDLPQLGLHGHQHHGCERGREHPLHGGAHGGHHVLAHGERGRCHGAVRCRDVPAGPGVARRSVGRQLRSAGQHVLHGLGAARGRGAAGGGNHLARAAGHGARAGELPAAVASTGQRARADFVLQPPARASGDYNVEFAFRGITKQVTVQRGAEFVSPPRSISAPAPDGGTRTLTVSSPSAPACGLGGGSAILDPAVTEFRREFTPSRGLVYSEGLLSIRAEYCYGPSPATFTLTTPRPVPAGSMFWMLSGTKEKPLPHWHAVPVVVSGNTASFTLADGVSDGDLVADGVITAFGGLAVAPPWYFELQDLWWGGLGENGWGVSIVQHDEKLFAVIFAYDGNGMPTWYVMPGGQWNAARTVFTGALYSPRGAPYTAYDPARLDVGPPVGTLVLTFTDATHATLDYVINGMVGRKQITRQPFAQVLANTRPIVGDMWWGGERQSGWGIAILQQFGTLFAAWFTYNEKGEPTWFVMPAGSWTATDTFEGRIYRTSSSRWLAMAYNTTSFRVADVGAFRVRFLTADTAVFEWDHRRPLGLAAALPPAVSK
jgi:hypothetical protein